MISSTPPPYVVKTGDCLSSIAARYGESLSVLEADNPQYSSDWDLIWPGGKVKVRSGNADPAAVPAVHPSASGDGPSPAAASVIISPPQTVVRSFFAAINAKNYATAWSLGGSNFGSTFKQFAAGFSDTSLDAVTITGVQGGNVSFNLKATHTDHSVHRYHGFYTVTGGKITGGHVTVVAPGDGPGTPSSGGTGTVSSVYVNPLKSVRGLRAERIDMGVDYSGNGPLRAVGAGTIVWNGGNGWPGLGGYIALKLSHGPLAGKVVYYAEDVVSSVSIGQHVSAGQVIGQLRTQGAGMEIGWASPGNPGNTAASAAGQYHVDGTTTAYGANFSRFLHALGAPAGLRENTPIGSVAAGYFTGNLGKLVSHVTHHAFGGPWVAGTPNQNVVTIAKFLFAHGYSRAAAAGVAICVWGESGGNPESVGSGGFGLIGWTGNTLGLPAGYHITGNATHDLLVQMQGIIGYNQAANPGALPGLNAQTAPFAAADYYSQHFERPAITNSDVHVNPFTESIFGAI